MSSRGQHVRPASLFWSLVAVIAGYTALVVYLSVLIAVVVVSR